MRTPLKIQLARGQNFLPSVRKPGFFSPEENLSPQIFSMDTQKAVSIALTKNFLQMAESFVQFTERKNEQKKNIKCFSGHVEVSLDKNAEKFSAKGRNFFGSMSQNEKKRSFFSKKIHQIVFLDT